MARGGPGSSCGMTVMLERGSTTAVISGLASTTTQMRTSGKSTITTQSSPAISFPRPLPRQNIATFHHGRPSFDLGAIDFQQAEERHHINYQPPGIKLPPAHRQFR